MKIRLLKSYVCKGGGLTVFLLFGLISICQSIPTSGTQRIARDVAGVTSETSGLITKLRESTAKGMGVAKELVEEASACITGISGLCMLIHDQMKTLEEVTVSLDNRALDLSQKYYHEFYPIKGNLRKTRLGLKKLATETVLMSKKMQIFFKNAERLGDKKALKLQMTTLERFLIKSIPILREAGTEYESALTKLEHFEPMMHKFLVELNKEVRETGQKIKDLKNDKREKEDEAVVLDREIRDTRQEITDMENDKREKENEAVVLDREIRNTRQEITDMEKDKRKKEDEAVVLEREIRSTRQKITDMETDKREKEDEAIVLDKEIRKTRQNIMDLENEKERKEGSVTELNRRITENEGEINYGKNAKGVLGGVYAAGSAAMLVLDFVGCFGVCSLIFHAPSLPTVVWGLDGIESNIEDFRNRKETLSRQLATIRRQLAQAPGKIAAYERRVEINNRNIESIKGELRQLPSKIAAYERRVESNNRNIESIRRELRQLPSKIAAYERRVEINNRNTESIRRELRQLPDKIAAYEERVAINNRNIENIRRELSQLSGTIGNYENQLKKTKESAERISATITNLKSKLDGATTFLVDELVIINEWKANVDSVKESIEDIPLEDVPILRDVFVIGIDELQDSAQKFLDRPDDVFGDNDESTDFGQL